MKLRKRAILMSIAMLSASLVAAAQQVSSSAADARKDPVLSAMLDELARSQQQLQLQNFQKPFFIQYVLDDLDSYSAFAAFGAISLEQQQHRRIVRVTVRVGDYKMDSSSSPTAQADGALQLAAIDNDPAAIRFALWSATDTAYKAALSEYTQKQAALKAIQTPPSADDFSHEKAVVSIGPLSQIDFDSKLWTSRVAAATGLYQNAKQPVEDMTGHVNARTLNRYIVNTDGTIVRKGSAEYLAAVSAGTQASDGMRLERSYSTLATTPAGLDSAEKFRAGVTGILNSLHDLASAPVIADEYHGPVLFSGDASSDVFHQLFAPAVVAYRPDPGTTERTRGPYSSSYQTRVLPDFLTVIDDPSLTTFDGKGLFGSYLVDDEGVPAQKVTLVDQGKLVNYLIGRQPVKDFPVSNGHARSNPAAPPRPGPGVLRIEAAKPLSADELNTKLLALGKDQGLDAVYAVQTFGPGLTPRLLYKIDVASGKRELVRGAALGDLDQRSLRSGIRAAGNDTYVDNIYSEAPLTTILAPSLVIDDVTVKRAEQRNDKLPYYPPPD